ncbi:hypothetical protein CORMATOL_01652 [Corynebacterium matruchotii ATCC 33806]|uniref:Uncharacterized protein n=1 Tax=Corynebacterium matruchotii ATCC 33806 TaxID=566549 RepID=C0E3T6_9CORY|nr:hypothetical protein CORMATOL_01652 [Corynebacterium matruchotii ATCC 33806]
MFKENHSWYDHMWYTDPLKCDVGLIERLLLFPSCLTIWVLI